MTDVPNRAAASPPRAPGKFAKDHCADPPQVNRGMKRKLAEDKAIDLADCPREGQYYVLDRVIEGKDYCDTRRNVWIWSIGKRVSDGKILASIRTDLYEHPDFICLWLR